MKPIPMLDLNLEYEYMQSHIDTAIRRCLEHQRWILGPEVKELEEKIAGYLGTKHCIGISSGTDALVLSLRALAIKLKGQEYFDRSDEIITTSFTFTATGDAILRAGATPVFVDVDPNTYNIDPQQIEKYLDSQSPLGVVGIMPVHLYGHSCSMDAIMALADKHRLFVLEDVAQAFGGLWKGRKLGAMGTVGAFSFFPSKNLGGFGDGGMVATNDDEIADLVQMLLRHGGKNKYNVEHIGYNARLDTLQAAVLLAKFGFIDEFNERRRKIAARYHDGLKGIAGIRLPESLPDACHVYHQYTIRVLEGKRDALQKYLGEHHISTMVYYPVALHKMKVFEGRSRIFGDAGNAESLCHQVLSLPVEPLMGDADIERVIDTIRRFFV